MKLSFSSSAQRSFLPFAPAFFIFCLILALSALFLAGRFAYEKTTQSLSVSVDAKAQSQLPVVQFENLKRFEKRLDPALRLKWEGRAREIQSQAPSL